MASWRSAAGGNAATRDQQSAPSAPRFGGPAEGGISATQQPEQQPRASSTSPPSSQQSSSGGGAPPGMLGAAQGGMSAWTKPPGILGGTTQQQTTQQQTAQQQTVPLHADDSALHADSSLHASSAAALPSSLVPSWSSSAFAPSFPAGSTASAPLANQQADLFAQFAQQQQQQQQAAGGFFSMGGMTPQFLGSTAHLSGSGSQNGADLHKSLFGGGGGGGAGVGSANAWGNNFSSLSQSASEQQPQQTQQAQPLQQQQQQLASDWSALPPLPAGSVGSLGAPGSSPLAEVQSHFASLSAQHNGQLPINEQALASLLQSASAMPPGDDQQRLLTMIDIMLQLHNNAGGAPQQQQQANNAQQGQTQQQMQANGQQQQQQQHQAMSSSQYAEPNGWGSNGGSAFNPNSLSNGLTFPFNNSQLQALQSGNLGTPLLGSSFSGQLAPDLLALSSTSLSGGVSGSQGNASSGHSSLLMNLGSLSGHQRSDSDVLSQLQPQQGAGGRFFPDQSPISAITPAAPAADWTSLPQFQPASNNPSSSSTSSSLLSGANHSSSLLSSSSGLGSSDFASPLRPPRTNITSGYNDVPELASPFYDQYTNLSVTARPFQPTQHTQQQQTHAGVSAGDEDTDKMHADSAYAHSMHDTNSMLQQQQDELSASIAALQSASDASRNLLGGAQFDGLGVDQLAAINYQHSQMQQLQQRGGPRSRDQYGAGPPYRGGGVGGDRYGQRSQYGDRFDHGRRGRSNDYARSGLDRFDYIQQQVNQASKAKRNTFDDSLAGAQQPRTTTSVGGQSAAETLSQLHSLQSAHNLTPSQQSLLAQLVAQTEGDALAAAPSSPSLVSSSGAHASPPVLDAAAALKQLTASPEFQSLTPQQQAQIYLSVQEVQQKQQQGKEPAGSSLVGTGGGSPLLGALSSPLSSSVSILPSDKVEDVLLRIVKPDLAKLSEQLRMQQLAITNAALGNSSTPSHLRLHEPQPSVLVEVAPDKSKLRPPKMRARLTTFPDEAGAPTANVATATTASAAASATAGHPQSSQPQAAATPTPVPAPAVVQSATAHLQSLLSNSGLSHSARVAAVRNVSASASAAAFARHFTDAIVGLVNPTVHPSPHSEAQNSANKQTSQQQQQQPQPTAQSKRPQDESQASLPEADHDPSSSSGSVSSSMRVRKRAVNPAAALAQSASAPVAPSSSSSAPAATTPAASPSPAEPEEPQQQSQRGGARKQRGPNASHHAAQPQPSRSADPSSASGLPSGPSDEVDAPKRQPQRRQPQQRQQKGTPAAASATAGTTNGAAGAGDASQAVTTASQPQPQPPQQSQGQRRRGDNRNASAAASATGADAAAKPQPQRRGRQPAAAAAAGAPTPAGEAAASSASSASASAAPSSDSAPAPAASASDSDRKKHPRQSRGNGNASGRNHHNQHGRNANQANAQAAADNSGGQATPAAATPKDNSAA